MAVVVSYEILTTVKKSFHHKKLRGYVFFAQIIVTGMKERNFHQIEVPYNGGSVAVIPMKLHIQTTTTYSKAQLKTQITARMEEAKTRYEGLLVPVPTKKAAVNLVAAGSYKNTLTKVEDL